MAGSHSSGIAVSNSLRQTFGDALAKQDVRLVQVKIKEEKELIDVTSKDVSGSFEDDFELVQALLEPNSPCYILYRTDEANVQSSGGHKWLLFCYVPDKAKVREKMLYASTRANLKLQLGAGNFRDEIFGTVPDDFSKAGYDKHAQMKIAEVPLTSQEISRKEEEEQSGVYVGGGSTYVHGVTFPVDDAVLANLTALKSGTFNYIQMKIDPDKEIIFPGETKTVNVGQLGSFVSTVEPCFHFYRWDHQSDGESFKSIVFIYSCPDGSEGTKSAPVKLRMLYSSSKANAETIAKKQGLEINAKLEVNTGRELTEDVLLHVLHPKKAEKKQAFNKPKGPARGARRLNKTNQ